MSNVAPALGPGPAISLPETVPTLHSRSLIVAPSDRQRTIQACDKCRERKTKCSGKHPVCHRCKMRGLICQYSSREPRSRGPTRARLRNAVSSTELRTPPSPLEHIHSPTEMEFESSLQPLRRASSYYDNFQDYPTLGEHVSIPRSFHLDPERRKVPFNTATFETVHEASTQHNGHDQTFPTFLSSSPHANLIHRTTQWRDVRRVHSHSALIGPTGSDMNGDKLFGYHNANSLDDSSEWAPYKHWSTPGHVSSPAVIFDSFGQLTPSSTSVEPQSSYYHAPRAHLWNYHSDGGSTNSEPLSSGEIVPGYSPSSSEDVPEPSGRTSSIGVISNSDSHQYGHMGHNFPEYTHNQDFEFGYNYRAASSREGCGSQFYQTPELVQSDGFVRQGIMPCMVTSDSDASVSLAYPSTYP